jgi:hypothetical protein
VLMLLPAGQLMGLDRMRLLNPASRGCHEKWSR